MEIVKNKSYQIVLANKDAIQTNAWHEVLFISRVLRELEIKFDVWHNSANFKFINMKVDVCGEIDSGWKSPIVINGANPFEYMDMVTNLMSCPTIYNKVEGLCYKDMKVAYESFNARPANLKDGDSYAVVAVPKITDMWENYLPHVFNPKVWINKFLFVLIKDFIV